MIDSPVENAVVVTGIGSVCSLGATTEKLWQRITSGTRGLRDLDLFDTSSHRTKLAGQVDDSTLPQHFLHLARAEQFGCTATEAAIRNIPPELLKSGRTGVFFGSSTGALFEGEQFLKGLLESLGAPRGGGR